MRSFVHVCLLGLICSLMLGCVTQKEALTRQDIRACQQRCDIQLHRCEPLCHESCKACSMTANQTTRKHYHDYVQDRFIQGRAIARQLYAYRDPLECRKASCNCQADYRVCAQACTGTIHKRLQVEPTCC